MKRLALVLGVLAAGLLLAAPAQASFPGAAGKIAFDTTRDGDYEIYVMDPDGTDQTNLTNSPGITDAGPSWSPDGRQIAYGRGGQIWVMNADGSNKHAVVIGTATHYAPAWSPDGQKIAFTSTRSGNTDIYAVDANGLNEDRLTTDPATDSDPAWSPDGSTIVFHSLRDGDSDIWKMNPDGAGQTVILDTDAALLGPPCADAVTFHEQHPDWSPDGHRVVFLHFEHDSGFACSDTRLGTVKPDGSAHDTYPFGPDDTYEPVWAPNASGQDFGSYRFAWGMGDIYVGDTIEGTNLTGASDGGRPSWQPLYQVPLNTAATFIQVPLIPNYRKTISATQCTARGGTPKTHAAPLVFTSCDPPRYLPGTVAGMGIQANPYVQINVVGGNPFTPPDDADQTVSVNVNDVRSGSALGADYNPNSTGPDVTAASKLRITDTQSGATQGDPATLIDLDLLVAVNCAGTADPNIGSSCVVNTSANGVTPGMVREGKNMVIQMNRWRVRDSGANGVRGDSDDREFAIQGTYVP